MTAVRDRYFGFKDISQFTSEIVYSLFDFPRPPRKTLFSKAAPPTKVVPPLPDFLAYILLRTALPNSTVYHALHLLGRLSFAHTPFPSTPIPPQTLPHFLLLCSLNLATTYSMDNSYATDSWSIASRSLFTVSQIDDGILWMLSKLDWVLRIPATRDEEMDVLEKAEDLMEVAEKWEEAFVEWKCHPIDHHDRLEHPNFSNSSPSNRKRMSSLAPPPPYSDPTFVPFDNSNLSRDSTLSSSEDSNSCDDDLLHTTVRAVKRLSRNLSTFAHRRQTTSIEH
ncbi:hypothetical protein BT69DRAFT_1276939 [Atractiella rhizophila]|nr:hypothetical protein BT69DRAFT_1276939 [Atractiella rhizophila]